MIELDNSFMIPASLDEAWRTLLDIERIAPCMPGARLETVTGDEFEGSFKVKLGVTAITYRGKAAIVQQDAQAYRAALNASAEETRGNGSAKAAIVFSLAPADGATEVSILTSLDVTGTPAQLGRGVLAKVAVRLTDQFAERLREELASARPGPAADAASAAIPPDTAGTSDGSTNRPGAPPAQSPPSSDTGTPGEPVGRLAAARAAVTRRSAVKRAVVAVGVVGALIVAIRAVRDGARPGQPDAE